MSLPRVYKLLLLLYFGRYDQLRREREGGEITKRELRKRNALY